ncbi:MAG: hypothetical protein ABI968_02375, partial [Acidobacteriota bacterium]
RIGRLPYAVNVRRMTVGESWKEFTGSSFRGLTRGFPQRTDFYFDGIVNLPSEFTHRYGTGR